MLLTPSFLRTRNQEHRVLFWFSS